MVEWLTNENVCDVAFGVFFFQLNTVFVNIVIFAYFDMGINYYSDSSVRSFDLLVHYFNLRLSEILRIEFEVLKHLLLTVLLSPLNIHP